MRTVWTFTGGREETSACLKPACNIHMSVKNGRATGCGPRVYSMHFVAF